MKETVLHRNSFVASNYLWFHEEFSCDRIAALLDVESLYALTQDGGQMVTFDGRELTLYGGLC